MGGKCGTCGGWRLMWYICGWRLNVVRMGWRLNVVRIGMEIKCGTYWGGN